MGEKFMSYHPDPLIREYHDRGMAKWMGFYLSEHTAEMESEKKERNLIWPRKPQMDEFEISEILRESYLTKISVEIQLDTLNSEGYALADIVGIVMGFDDTNIFLSVSKMDIQVIPNESINHINLVDHVKWSEIS